MSLYMLDTLSRLPDEAFHDDKLFGAELALLFRSRWCFALHAGRLGAGREWVCLRVGGREILFVTGDDGQIRAFPNRCLHKGESFLEAGATERSAVLRCHHHGWVYGLEGHLIAGPGFDLSSRARSPVLPTVPVFRDGPFVFVGPEMSVQSSGRLPEVGSLLVTADELLVDHSTLEMRVNWKVVARFLCERGWIYRVPHVLTFRDQSGPILARLEPLAPARTLVDVEFTGPPSRQPDSVIEGLQTLRDVAETTGAVPSEPDPGTSFDLRAILALLEEVLAHPAQGDV